MGTIEISEDNLDDFAALLGEDLCEDMKRIYYGGIGAVDDDEKAVGAFVYELLHSESEEDTKSRICMVRSDDKQTADAMHAYYLQTSVKEDEVVESFYELESEEEAKALAEHGFTLEKKEDDVIAVTLGELGQTEVGKKHKFPDYIGNIGDLTILQFRDAVKQILFKGHMGVIEDIAFLSKGWFDAEISACVSSGERVTGLFLIRRTPSGVLIPVLFFAYGPEYRKNLGYMLSYSIQMALRIYPPETVVRISRKSPATRALTEKLIPGRIGSEIFCGSRKEAG